MSEELLSSVMVLVCVSVLVSLCALVRQTKLARILSVAGLVLTLIMFSLYRSQFIALYSDAPFHLAMIKECLVTGRWLSPGDPFFRGAVTPLHFSLLHVLGAAFMSVTGSLSVSWALLGGLYLVLTYAVAYLFAKTCYERAQYAHAFALLLLIVYATCGDVPSFSRTAGLLVMAAFSIMLHETRRPRHKIPYVLLVGVITGTALSTRLYTGFLGYILVLTYLLGLLFLQRSRSAAVRVLLVAVVPLLVSAPWISNLFNNLGVISAMTCDEGNTSVPSYVATRVWAIEEVFSFIPYAWTKIVSTILYSAGCVFAMSGYPVRPSAKGALRYLILFVLIVYLVPFEFLLTWSGLGTAVVNRAVSVGIRVLSLVPPAFVTFLVAVSCNEWLEERPGLSGRLSMVPVVAIVTLILVGPAVHTRLKCEAGPLVPPRMAYVYANNRELLEDLEGKTVLSDEWTSYMLKYELGFYCVVCPEGHSSAAVDTRERIREAGEFFSGKFSDSDAEAFLEKYSCDFVLVNRRLAEGRHVAHFENVPLTCAKYDYASLLSIRTLDMVFETPDVALFRVETAVRGSAE